MYLVNAFSGEDTFGANIYFYLDSYLQKYLNFAKT